MGSMIRTAALLLGLLTVLTGALYPALVTAVAQAAFPKQANGSLLRDGPTVVGSELIGQPFDDARYFWGRPSATTPYPYDGGASNGSNLGPSNPALRQAIEARIAALHTADPGNDAPVPVDLVTSSGSGLDPHITPAAAFYQVARVARVRGLSEARVRALVEMQVQPRTWGMLGEPRVNVLQLNLALDRLLPTGV